MQECSSAGWNPKDTSVWGESTHYAKGMSQQYLIMIAISKHSKHLIHNNSGPFQWGSLYLSVLG